MFDHRQHGSICTVLTVTGLVNGEWEILTPYRIETPEPIDKKFGIRDYVRETMSYAKLVQIPSMGRFWANRWNITLLTFLFIYITQCLSFIASVIHKQFSYQTVLDNVYCSYHPRLQKIQSAAVCQAQMQRSLLQDQQVSPVFNSDCVLRSHCVEPCVKM